MGITDSLLDLQEQKPEQSSWVRDLVANQYKPKTERLKRAPVGFDFKRDPFDPSSYYKQLGTFRDISQQASQNAQLEAANRAAAQAQAAHDANQAALQNALAGLGSAPPSAGEAVGRAVGGSSHNYGLQRVSANTGKAANYWGSLYGIKSIGGYSEHGSVPGSDHPKGRALDFMINNIKNGTATGTSLANDVIKNYKAWNVKYVIWNRYIWQPGRGWHKYSGPSPHTDHVHVSFNK